MWGDWNMMWGGGGWWGILGMIFWLIILVAVIAGVIWLVRPKLYSSGDGLGVPRRPSGLDILEERYARGEIDRDEYLTKKRDLSGSGPA